ncbi:hypothetical protein INR49_020464 [Caranx melampygus]|nr:hypothetical protein INR49_020464 [Caranx melampygus]
MGSLPRLQRRPLWTPTQHDWLETMTLICILPFYLGCCHCDVVSLQVWVERPTWPTVGDSSQTGPTQRAEGSSHGSKPSAPQEPPSRTSLTDRPVHCLLQVDQRGILQVPGSEWAVFRLGHTAVIRRVEVDTNHFKGNFPDSCRIEACTLSPEEEARSVATRWRTVRWQLLLRPQKLRPHHRHLYGEAELSLTQPVTHVRLVIAPDGGVSRLRLWGQATPTTTALTSQQAPAAKL